MKKSFFKVSGLAGLMLLGGLTMVSCYEGDDNEIDYVTPVTPTPTPAKYFLSGAVLDSHGNQIAATVKVNGETYTTSGSFSKEVSLTSDRKYTVEATCTGYVSVTRDVYMTEVSDGQIGTQYVEITMTKLEDVIADNQTPTEVKAVEISESEEEAIGSSLLDELTNSEIIDMDEVKDMKVETAAQADGSIDVAITLTAKTGEAGDPKQGYVVECPYPVVTGFSIVSKPTKADLTPEDMWAKQVSNFLGGMTYPSTTTWKTVYATVEAGKLLKGMVVNFTMVEKEFTFAAGENLENYTGTVRYVEGSTTCTPIIISEAHDDSHDDSHTTDSGTSYGGGTSTAN